MSALIRFWRPLIYMSGAHKRNARVHFRVVETAKRDAATAKKIKELGYGA